MTPSSLYLLLGARIRRAREAKGLPLWRVAVACDLSIWTVHHWEDGTVRMRVDQLLTVAVVLGVTVAALLEDAGDHAPQGVTVPFDGMAGDVATLLEGFE